MSLTDSSAKIFQSSHAYMLSYRQYFWAVMGLVIALGGPLALTSEPAQMLYELGGSEIAASFLGQAGLWVVLGCALACLTFGERLPLACAGLVRPRISSILWGAGIGLGVYAALVVLICTLLFLGLFEGKAASAVVIQWPLWLRIFAAVTAGIVEETLYRGYAIERLGALTGRRWLAAILTLAAFAVAHVPFWGLGAIATPLLGGAFFTFVYFWRRDLIMCITAHIFVDVVSLVILPLFSGNGG